MDDKIEEVESRQDLKDLEKEVLLEQTRRTEQQQARRRGRGRSTAEQKRQGEGNQLRAAIRRSVRCRTVTKCMPSSMPPIPPLLLALAVFFRRRELERQGVARERLR